MPLVRISLPIGHALSREVISAGVQDAMVSTFNVPEDDLFQIISEHEAAKDIVHPPSFRAVDFTDGMIVIQITCADGRTIDQKRALYDAVATNLSSAGMRREDVVINLVETKRENWSFGNGKATFA